MTLTLVFAKDEPAFEEFKRWQFKPEEFSFARDETTVMRQHKVNVIFVPHWLENPEYQKIRNLKQLISKIRK